MAWGFGHFLTTDPRMVRSQRVFKETEGVNEAQTTLGLPFHVSRLKYF